MNEREKCPNCGSNERWFRHAGCGTITNNCVACADPWHDAPQPAAEPIALSPSLTERKYEALYAEAREFLCSCNLVDSNAEPGSSMNYTCEWCAEHPEGADAPPLIQTLWEIRAEFTRRKATLEEDYGKERLARELDDADNEFPQFMRARGWYEAVVRVLEMLGEGTT